MVITFLPGSVYLFIYMCWFGATSASIDTWHDFSFRRENVKADSNLSYFSSRSPSELNCCECRLGDIEICVALVHLTSSELRSYLKNRVKTLWSERRFTFFLCIQLLSAIKVSALTWHMWFHMMGGRVHGHTHCLLLLFVYYESQQSRDGLFQTTHSRFPHPV